MYLLWEQGYPFIFARVIPPVLFFICVIADFVNGDVAVESER